MRGFPSSARWHTGVMWPQLFAFSFGKLIVSYCSWLFSYTTLLCSDITIFYSVTSHSLFSYQFLTCNPFKHQSKSTSKTKRLRALFKVVPKWTILDHIHVHMASQFNNRCQTNYNKKTQFICIFFISKSDPILLVKQNSELSYIS